MNQIVTEAIILSRIEYGEADRILTLLTPDRGKLSLMAKGVRRVKSKLAGGIELFSISTITFVKGRGEVGTLVSARLVKHYSHIVEDLDRTMAGYELTKELNRITEDQPGAEYFELLQAIFEALNDSAIDLQLVRLWFLAQLLRISGHTPNLRTDVNGELLDAQRLYNFRFEPMAFESSDKGRFTANHIKFLRLLFANHTAKILQSVKCGDAISQDCISLLKTMEGIVY